jgi:tetratricopeptide (TPR) repeat protein
LTLEPRTIDPASGVISAWDISTEPEGVVWEAKLAATRQDIVEWLERIGRAESSATPGKHRFGLVYGQAKTPVISGLMRLREVAIECGGDERKFDGLAGDSDQIDLVRKYLGPGYRKTLERLTFQMLPEDLLRNTVEDRAQFLAGENHQLLVMFLFHLFSQAAAERRHYYITELIELIRQQSIRLSPPPGRMFADLPIPERQALLLLSACPAGLPIAPLAHALGVEERALETCLSTFVDQKLIVKDSGVLRYAGLAPDSLRDEGPFLAASLDGLLDWLSGHELADSAALVTRAAIRIAETALRVRPGLALKLFQATEHVVKNIGDKHLLMHISEMCLHAANDLSETDRELKARAKAQAMLCGHCWVYQRTGRLAEAEVWAERSEGLGESIGWGRNTAFAKKCRGRLSRMIAEDNAEKDRRGSHLRASEDRLNEAIALFSMLAEYGPVHRQVGDCYSLLARTQYVGGNMDAASASLRRAYEIISPGATKEYFDLLILTGDVELARGNTDAAERSYSEVIDTHSSTDREMSEICARALFRRGQLRAHDRRKTAAVLDLQRAVDIWKHLDEHGRAGEAEWRIMQLEGRVQNEILRMFSKVEPPAVRVGAVTDYLARLKSVKAVAHRAIPTTSQVEQLAQAVRKRLAEEHPDW